MVWEPKVIDRKHEALGGQSNDRPLSAIKRIGWHYTATLNSFITNHERFWRDTYGWDRGGYHAYISRDGTIYINYDLRRMTWGVANNNWDTVHMSLEASNASNYTEAQIKSRDWLTRKWMKELNLPASAVQGHWEIYNNTVCPGYTRVEMNNFRAQLAKVTPVVSGAAVHKVQTEDTLWSLSTKYDMTVDQLKSLNGLDSNLIVVGQELKVKGTAPEPQKPALKALDVVAQEVINGTWGNGSDRKIKLEKAGYNYHDVQATVERVLGAKSLKSIETIADEVIDGKWGNGDDRKRKLTAAGYNANDVQKRVDQTFKDNKQPKKEVIHLSSSVSAWRIYPLGVAPIASNAIGSLNPKRYAPMKYEVLGRQDSGATAIIKTQDFGKVKLFVDSDARITFE